VEWPNLVILSRSVNLALVSQWLGPFSIGAPSQYAPDGYEQTFGAE
jgi:hypothetical protein